MSLVAYSRMLFILIPISIMLAGVVLAGRVIYKKIPPDVGRWNETVAKENFGPPFYEKALAAAALKSKETLLAVSTKLVYRLKITSLKTDNFFGKLLQEIRNHKSNLDETRNKEVPAHKPVEVSLQPFKVQTTPVSEDIPPTLTEESSKVKPFFTAREQQLVNQLAYNPKDVAAYKHLGWLYLESNKPMEARQAFKIAVKLGSRDRLVITKLLEMGGTVHKEGVEPETKAVFGVAVAGSRISKPKKAKKIRIRKV